MNQMDTMNSSHIWFDSHITAQNNDFIRLSSTIQFIHLIVLIQSLPIYRMIKYNTFLLWSLNQTRLFQFGSSISHKFLIFILNIDHTKDWNMLAKPIWVVMKWWKRVNGWLDPKSINDQRMMVRGLEQTNRVSIEYSMIIERSGMEWNGCVDPMLELLPLDFDTITQFTRNLYEWNQINLTILEIDFDRTSWNE